MGRPTQNHANKARVAEEQVRCYRLRLDGWTIRAIAAEVGLSTGTVENRIKAEIASKVTPLADEYRKMELDRLDRMYLALAPKIEAGDEKAVQAALKVLERRAKYLGLDAAIKTDVTVHEVDATDTALAELLNEQRMKTAATEAELRRGGE